MSELVINLDELDLRELFEIRHQRTRDGVKRPIRLTIPFQINMYSPICKDKPAVACKAIEYESKSFVPFHITGTLEELIKNRSNPSFGREGKARHRDLVRKLTSDQPLIICEVNVDLCIHGCTRWRGDATWRKGERHRRTQSSRGRWSPGWDRCTCGSQC